MVIVEWIGETILHVQSKDCRYIIELYMNSIFSFPILYHHFKSNYKMRQIRPSSVLCPHQIPCTFQSPTYTIIQLIQFQSLIRLHSMGNTANAITRQNTNKFQHLKYIYQAKRLGDSKKSMKQFQTSLAAIYKKLSFINYSWSKEIIHQLQTNQASLYLQYQKILIQNCQRDGRKQKIFLSQTISQIFKDNIKRKYQIQTVTLSWNQLKALIEECKHFFMVLTWFHKIGSLSQIDIHSMCCLEEQSDQSPDQHERQCTEEDKMCNYLMIIACKTFRDCFAVDRRATTNVPAMFQSKQAIQVYPFLSKIKRNICFCQKQKAIQDVQSVLMKIELKKFHKNINFIEKVVEKSQMLGYLLVMREMSNIDVEFLWKIFCEKHLKALLEE